MGDRTLIEWTDTTWNPVTGCTKVSAGCANCYAERWAKRTFKGRSFSEVHCHPERLEEPLHWRKPRRVLVCSMGDLFHEKVPDNFIAQVLQIIAHEHGNHHTYQILTKRPKRMLEIIQRLEAGCLCSFWDGDEYGAELVTLSAAEALPHLWLGVSIEDQKTVDERIPLLLQTPAAVRFVSIEPILGPVELDDYFDDPGDRGVGLEPRKGLDWVILGGETGPRARPMHPDWVRSIREQCQAAGVPFFFKQWGEHVHGAVGWQGPHVHVGIDGRRWTDEREMRRAFNCSPAGYSVATMCRIGRNRAGRLLDGRTWDEMPKVNSAWGSSDK